MPAPSGPRSGKHGIVSGETYIRNWTLNRNFALEDRVHSATRGGHERMIGVEDWNGTIEGFGGFPTFFPGDLKTPLVLFAGPSSGVYGANGMVWTGNAIIDSLTINWGWQPNQSLNWSAAFSANGCLEYTEGDYVDAGTACATQMCDLPVTYQDECVAGVAGTGDEGVFTAWNNMESATLTITSDNQPVVNSSTACCTQRIPGNLDWTLSIVDQEQYPVLFEDQFYRFRMYVTDETYWSLAFGMLQDISNVRVDIESGAIITKSNDFVMSGRMCCYEAGTSTAGSEVSVIGEIENPSGVRKWPVAAA